MPNYRTHFFAGILVYILALVILPLNGLQSVVFFFIASFYSLLPDVDIANSKAGKVIRKILGLFSVVAILIGYFFSRVTFIAGITFLIVLVILQFVRHRGFIHTGRAAFLFSLPLLAIGYPEAVFGFLNYCIHLLLDRSLNI